VKPPARFISGNLVWTRDASVWAVWGVTPASFAYISGDEKLAFHERIRSSLIALPTDSLILSVCGAIDYKALAKGMLAGADRREDWRQACGASLQTVMGWSSYERRFYVAARLGAGDRSLRHQVAALAASLTRGGGVPSGADRGARHAEAGRLAAALRRSLDLTTPDAGELRWLYARALHRGIADQPFDGAWSTPEVQQPALTAIHDVVLTEGGDRRDQRRGLLGRYLRVAVPSAAGERVGYQVHLALADLPARFEFPGAQAELLVAADRGDYPVDWAVRMTSKPNAEALRLLRRRARALMGQVDEQETEIDRQGAVPPDLAQAHEALSSHRQRLSDNRSEGEIRATFAFCVWSADLVEAEERAEGLAGALAPTEYGLVRPIGGQAGLLEMGLPGGRLAQVVKDYAQWLLPTDVAACAPFAGSELGDATGMVLGGNLDTGAVRPVLWNPEAPLDAEQSASAGFFGTLGSGKSYLLKRGSHAVLARGGRVLAIDRTATREWTRFANAMTCSMSIFEVGPSGKVSLDPFGVFSESPGDAKIVATGFALMVTQAATGDLEGISISEAVEAVARAPKPTMRAVIIELARMRAEGHEGAAGASRKLEAFARSPLGGMVFDPALPALDLSADLIIFSVPDLALPEREVLANAHLARQMLPEQVGALGLFYLVAAVGRAVAIAERTRFAVLVCDEAWALTNSPQGLALLETTARDGRKRRGAVWLATQHPEDVPDEKLLAWLTTRFVFGQGRRAGAAALRMLGVEASPELVTLVEETIRRRDDPQAAPEPAVCLMLDSQGRVGKVAIAPARPPLDAALETNAKRVEAFDRKKAGPGNGSKGAAQQAPTLEVVR
jgi:hypothetical protein